ncbi:Hypothetical predicted protein [Cloeon dipterum]|uniref:ATP synthase-coupling factor 6, mitochondrial n=1 Tax=Cloeon dipterum TaxID=197152 RepID=A0A8S1CK92_9INSE|nr:Hypothetical predicted protein [Cloeon dipterum]
MLLKNAKIKLIAPLSRKFKNRRGGRGCYYLKFIICRHFCSPSLNFLPKHLVGKDAPLAKAADPVQQLFIDKIRDYAQKSKAANGKLVDASPEIQKELAAELEKAAKQYGGGQGPVLKNPLARYEMLKATL